ncbi:hypothetical protein, partial [Acidaminococcus intestini]|uniref:hypothetical protein n=1 Tax=Acidaminococcus intestini TaxID=187327 RepID=UPI0030790A37
FPPCYLILRKKERGTQRKLDPSRFQILFPPINEDDVPRRKISRGIFFFIDRDFYLAPNFPPILLVLSRFFLFKELNLLKVEKNMDIPIYFL